MFFNTSGLSLPRLESYYLLFYLDLHSLAAEDRNTKGEATLQPQCYSTDGLSNQDGDANVLSMGSIQFAIVPECTRI